MGSQKTKQIAGDDVLDVWFEDRIIGFIERTSDSVLDLGFRYSSSWRGTRGAFPISINMPLSAETYEPSLVYPWLLNLLPEGTALHTIGNVLKVHEMDVFGMLSEMGRDLPGALDIRKHNASMTSPKARYRRLTESELANIIRMLPERPLLVGEDGVHMSMAGVQDKLPVVRFSNGSIGLALNGAPSTHILKPRSDRFWASVENEAFCLRLAAAAGLPAAHASIGRAEDIEYLLVERYDRVMDHGLMRRIHQEDLCQATAYPPYLKYEWNHSIAQRGPGLKACLESLGKTSTPGRERIRFLQSMLFNVLCGNVDAHAKNYSILIRAGSAMSMAPLYDVMNADIYEGVTRNLAMKIAGKQRAGHIHARHWERFAQENGLSARQILAQVEKLSKTTLEALPRVVEDMQRIHGAHVVYGEISKFIGSNARNMLNNLKSVPMEPDDDAASDKSDEEEEAQETPQNDPEPQSKGPSPFD